LQGFLLPRCIISLIIMAETTDNTIMNIKLIYKLDAATPIFCNTPWFRVTATFTPAKRAANITKPNFLSTFPISLCFLAPIMAFPNLWVILAATAIIPGIPRLIMAGVIIKAPPVPIKPLKRPPVKPITASITAVSGVMLIKPMASDRFLTSPDIFINPS